MEQYFTPARRLQETLKPHGYTEVELAASTSIEAFMNHRWDWSDFWAFLTTGDDEGGEDGMWKVLWIAEDTLMWAEKENSRMTMDLTYKYATQRVKFTVPSGETHVLVLAKRSSQAEPVGGSSIFWRAVTTSNCSKLSLSHRCSHYKLLPGPDLLQLWASPSLELLKFDGVTFQDTHCLALATLQRTGLQVAFRRCSFKPSSNAKDAFIEWLRYSQVVTKLEFCSMEDSISALSGNSSVKSLSINTSRNRSCNGNDNIRALAGVLAGNQGIEDLHVVTQGVSRSAVEALSLLSRSLCAHPRIQSLRLSFNAGAAVSVRSETSMMDAVLHLAQCNTVVQTIDLPDHAKDEIFFQHFIVPRLEMNRNCFADQRQALTRTDPSIRGQLLGRALHVVRYNPDLLFRFLSENVTALVRSDAEDGPTIPTTTTCTGQKQKVRPWYYALVYLYGFRRSSKVSLARPPTAIEYEAT
jgi:hypothetical protein